MITDEKTITRNGREYRVSIVRDDIMRVPWEEEDGHGPVTEWTNRAKLPGELVLAEDRGSSRRFYDFAAAMKQARAEGWNAPPYRDDETKGERAAKAVRADFERLREWCNDEWWYVGVVVEPKCSCCGEWKDAESESIWGIESDAGDYLDEVAEELIDEIEARISYQSDLSEKFELAFWGGISKRRYRRWHETFDEAETEALKILGSLSNRAAHPAIVYGPGCGPDGTTIT